MTRNRAPSAHLLLGLVAILAATGACYRFDQTSEDTTRRTDTETRNSDSGAAADSSRSDTDTASGGIDAVGDTRSREAGDQDPSCSADAGLADIPEPSAGAFYVPKTEAFAIDSDLEEATSAQTLAFSDASGDSDNRVEMVSQWSADRLYLGFRVDDTDIDADGSPDPWKNDGIEFGVDPGGAEGDGLSGDELKWLVTADGTRYLASVEDNKWSGVDQNPAEVATRQTDDGYLVELAIPASELTNNYQVGQRLTVEFVNNDRDAGTAHTFRWDGRDKQLAAPSQWGWLELAEASCRRTDGGNRDAGTDAAMETGTDADDAGNDYETIILAQDESKTVDVEDGETYTNKLIDASADGAEFQINASGSGWTIRNIGVKGPLPSSVSQVIRIQVNDPDGTGTIDHVYLEGAYKNFMFAHAHHEGHIDIKNSTFIDNLRDVEDILYGSPPGNPDANWGKQTGRGGTIHIDGCYGEKIGGYGWRLGSDGSKLENSVLVDQNVAVANLWSRDVEIRNVDIVNADIGLRLGSHIHGEKLSEPTRTVVDNVDISAETPVQRNEHQGQPPELVGSIGNNPDRTPPSSAPMSAEEAASGQ